ncbi:MAG TPA: hypothetical protein VNQ80_01180 [Parapedobacter sp.]|uniref:hypothetical protein n=1 Tax=Parapedobacter sp. TaxID=1958893 RepID=UPI002BA9F07D|nr:hypothetical protein [Parapedobacter sp.]HWK55915.1 hypothetical protein [Parapedobacter sp.]
MKFRIPKWLGLGLVIAPLGLAGQSLPATDALGRKLPTHDEVGDLHADKFVGMFYWTWHNHFADSPAYNVSELQKLNNGMFDDYDHPAWPEDASYYHWGEPLFGYYRSTDRWVLRRHAEMLADAGVDVVVFDCTNGSYTWEESYMALCEVFAEARKDGVNTPQIAFMLGFAAHEGSLAAITKIYQNLYGNGLYRDLWFQWKGKPLIMAYYEHLEAPTDDPQKERLYREIRQFFTFRPPQPVYDKGPQRDDHWGWLEIYPQHGFTANDKGSYEQVTVGVAQNWTKENGLSAMNAPKAFGRSYTHHGGHTADDSKIAYGLNFQEQWDRAIELDPEFVFVTGWNEWVAGRQKEWGGTYNAFPDLFDQEHSRDIEPMKGGHGDAYYYQLITNVRRFKGADPIRYAEKHTGIRIDGDAEDWNAVTLQFDAYSGNTKHRREQGWGNLRYENTTGRNDIIKTKATFDDDYVYFLVETAAPLTDASEPAWMNLLIDIDRDKNTGWEGYDFIVNRVSPRKGKAVLERNRGGWKWKRAGAVEFAVSDNRLELRIDRKALGITDTVDIEFKWTDNLPQSGDIMDFYQYGDVAPLGRFNYYLTSNSND